MTHKSASRRHFLKVSTGVGVAALSAPLLLQGCGKGEEGGLNCANPPGLTPQQRTQRTQLGYVDKGPDPSRHCDVCAFWTDPESPNTCGGCTLGLGPVHPKGTCNSFAPKPS